MTVTRLTGYDAIAFGEEQPLRLSRYDPQQKRLGAQDRGQLPRTRRERP